VNGVGGRGCLNSSFRCSHIGPVGSDLELEGTIVRWCPSA
jgi:hypothetical protein